jgi:transcriptional regulator with XRE-family HTH domain
MNPVRRWLSDTKTTEQELARLAGLHRNTISRLLHARLQPDVSTVRAVARVTGIPVATLLEDQNSA